MSLQLSSVFLHLTKWNKNFCCIWNLCTVTLTGMRVILTREQRCCSGAVQSASEGASSGAPAGPHGANGAIPLRRDHGALWIPTVLLIQQGGAVWIPDTEGGHTQTVTVTVLDERSRAEQVNRLTSSWTAQVPNIKTIILTAAADQVQHWQQLRLFMRYK